MDNSYSAHDVLLAEDDIDDVEIFGWALKEAQISHVLRHAENGARLFVLLQEKIPYILFLDIRMPCEDGISCIMKIRKNREYDRLPVIMYSGSSHAKYIESTYRQGANFFLVKSNSPANTVNHLKQIFSIDWTNFQHFPVLEEFVLH